MHHFTPQDCEDWLSAVGLDKRIVALKSLGLDTPAGLISRADELMYGSGADSIAGQCSLTDDEAGTLKHQLKVALRTDPANDDEGLREFVVVLARHFGSRLDDWSLRSEYAGILAAERHIKHRQQEASDKGVAGAVKEEAPDWHAKLRLPFTRSEGPDLNEVWTACSPGVDGGASIADWWAWCWEQRTGLIVAAESSSGASPARYVPSSTGPGGELRIANGITVQLRGERHRAVLNKAQAQIFIVERDLLATKDGLSRSVLQVEIGGWKSDGAPVSHESVGSLDEAFAFLGMAAVCQRLEEAMRDQRQGLPILHDSCFQVRRANSSAKSGLVGCVCATLSLLRLTVEAIVEYADLSSERDKLKEALRLAWAPQSSAPLSSTSSNAAVAESKEGHPPASSVDLPEMQNRLVEVQILLRRRLQSLRPGSSTKLDFAPAHKPSRRVSYGASHLDQGKPAATSFVDLKNAGNSVESALVQIVQKLRKQRPGLLACAGQYSFCFRFAHWWTRHRACLRSLDSMSLPCLVAAMPPDVAISRHHNVGLGGMERRNSFTDEESFAAAAAGGGDQELPPAPGESSTRESSTRLSAEVLRRYKQYHAKTSMWAAVAHGDAMKLRTAIYSLASAGGDIMATLMERSPPRPVGSPLGPPCLAHAAPHQDPSAALSASDLAQKLMLGAWVPQWPARANQTAATGACGPADGDIRQRRRLALEPLVEVGDVFVQGTMVHLAVRLAGADPDTEIDRDSQLDITNILLDASAMALFGPASERVLDICGDDQGRQGASASSFWETAIKTNSGNWRPLVQEYATLGCICFRHSAREEALTLEEDHRGWDGDDHHERHERHNADSRHVEHADSEPNFVTGNCGLLHMAAMSPDSRVLNNVAMWIRICLVREKEGRGSVGGSSGSGEIDDEVLLQDSMAVGLRDYLMRFAELLPRIVDSSYTMPARGTALQVAAVFGNIEVLKLLLRWGVDVEQPTDNGKLKTALHLVAQLGRSARVNAVRTLVRLGGANVEKRDYKGWTALIIASNIGASDVVDALCDEFASDVNYAPGDAGVIGIPDRFKVYCRWTSLHHAVRFGHSGIVRKLVQCGASPNAPLALPLKIGHASAAPPSFSPAIPASFMDDHHQHLSGGSKQVSLLQHRSSLTLILDTPQLATKGHCGALLAPTLDNTVSPPAARYEMSYGTLAGGLAKAVDRGLSEMARDIWHYAWNLKSMTNGGSASTSQSPSWTSSSTCDDELNASALGSAANLRRRPAGDPVMIRRIEWMEALQDVVLHHVRSPVGFIEDGHATLMTLACFRSSVSTVELLADLKEQCSPDQWTPSSGMSSSSSSPGAADTLARSRDTARLVELVREVFCFESAAPPGAAPLHIVADAITEEVGVAEVLCLRGSVDVNARDEMGVTPLHLACARGHINIVALLLTHNASVDLLTWIRDVDPTSADRTRQSGQGWKQDRPRGRAGRCRMLSRRVLGGVAPLHIAADPEWYGGGDSEGVDDGGERDRSGRELMLIQVSNGPDPVFETSAPHRLSDSDQLHIAGLAGPFAVCNGLVAISEIVSPCEFTVVDPSGQQYDLSGARQPFLSPDAEALRATHGEAEDTAVMEAQMAPPQQHYKLARATSGDQVVTVTESSRTAAVAKARQPSVSSTKSLLQGPNAIVFSINDNGRLGWANIVKALLDHGADDSRSTKSASGDPHRDRAGGLTAAHVAYRCYYRRILRHRQECERDGQRQLGPPGGNVTSIEGNRNKQSSGKSLSKVEPLESESKGEPVAATASSATKNLARPAAARAVPKMSVLPESEVIHLLEINESGGSHDEDQRKDILNQALLYDFDKDTHEWFCQQLRDDLETLFDLPDPHNHPDFNKRQNQAIISDAWLKKVQPIACWRLLVWVVFVTFFMAHVILQLHVFVDGGTHYMDDSFIEALVGEEWNPNQNLGFLDIREGGEFWDWVDNVLIAKVYGGNMIYRVVLDEGDEHAAQVKSTEYGLTTQSRVFGPIIFRQQRSEPVACFSVYGSSAHDQSSTQELTQKLTSSNSSSIVVAEGANLYCSAFACPSGYTAPSIFNINMRNCPTGCTVAHCCVPKNCEDYATEACPEGKVQREYGLPFAQYALCQVEDGQCTAEECCFDEETRTCENFPANQCGEGTSVSLTSVCSSSTRCTINDCCAASATTTGSDTSAATCALYTGTCPTGTTTNATGSCQGSTCTQAECCTGASSSGDSGGLTCTNYPENLCSTGTSKAAGNPCAGTSCTQQECCEAGSASAATTTKTCAAYPEGLCGTGTSKMAHNTCAADQCTQQECCEAEETTAGVACSEPEGMACQVNENTLGTCQAGTCCSGTCVAAGGRRRRHLNGQTPGSQTANSTSNSTSNSTNSTMPEADGPVEIGTGMFGSLAGGMCFVEGNFTNKGALAPYWFESNVTTLIQSELYAINNISGAEHNFFSIPYWGLNYVHYGNTGDPAEQANFVTVFPETSSKAKEYSKEMKDNNWIDMNTRVVNVEFIARNDNSEMYIAVSMKVEFSTLGSVMPSFSFRQIVLNDPGAPDSTSVTAIYAVAYAFWIYWIIEELRSIKKEGLLAHFRDPFNWYDVLMHTVFLVTIIMHTWTTSKSAEVREFVTQLRSADEYVRGGGTDRHFMITGRKFTFEGAALVWFTHMHQLGDIFEFQVSLVPKTATRNA